MYWIIQWGCCGGKKLRNAVLTRNAVLWPYVLLLNRFDKEHEHLRSYLPSQPVASVLQDKIYKWRKQLFTKSDTVSWHDLPQKGHSIITVNEFFIYTGTNLALLTSKKVQSLALALQIRTLKLLRRAVSRSNIPAVQNYLIGDGTSVRA